MARLSGVSTALKSKSIAGKAHSFSICLKGADHKHPHEQRSIFLFCDVNAYTRLFELTK